jgi:hypothetical protein
MYGIFQELNKENILKKIDSFNLFKYYCPGFHHFGKKFRSPLRPGEDKTPSASIIFYHGDLLFKDFGDDHSYRAIPYVIKYLGLSYRETLQKINCDFQLGLGGQYINYNEPIIRETLPEDQKIERDVFNIKIKRRTWNDEDYDLWWNKYKISQSTLEKFNVCPISNFAINDYFYFAEPLAYSYNYYWENKVFRRKIYQPFSINKWYNNGGLVVQGEGMLPRSGDLLIITSSLKDVMALYEMGYVAIAPTSEKTFVPEKYFYKQHGRFSRILLFMNSDSSGMEANIKLSEKWKLDYIYIPLQYKIKDISDFVDFKSQEEAKHLLKTLL